MLGKERRASRLFDPSTGRSVIVPVDDSLIGGPADGLANLEAKLASIALGRPNALLGFPGHFEQHGTLLSSLAWICNLTASTTRIYHTRKQQILSVRHALMLGCDSVAAHVNTTSRFEPEMLTTLASIIAEARELGVPVLAIMYPRSESSDGRDNNYEDLRDGEPPKYAELVCHAVRIAKDLGASMIKTQYTGSVESFRQVVAAASPIPVVIAGGPLQDPLSMLTIAADAVRAGGSGVSFGRNVYSRDNSTQMIQALRAVVHELLDPAAALDKYFL